MPDTPADPELVFNGVNARTGKYLTPPMSAKAVTRLALGDDTDAANRQVLKTRNGRDADATFRALADDPTDLAQTGWGVIFPFDGPPAVRDALTPLLDHRRKQAAAIKAGRFKVYAGPDGHRRQTVQGKVVYEDARAFLERQGVMAAAPADADRVPYYLLLVGSPEHIPYSFQYQLDVVYAVGRLWFENTDGSPDLDAFARYAASVVAAESPAAALPARRAAFFGVKNPDDRATHLSADELIQKLGDKLAETPRGWEFDTRAGTRTRKADLSALLGGPDTPALLLTASHGVEFDRGDPDQLAHQGALLCQDWDGPESGPASPDQYFSADDVPGDAKVHGLIAFHFACFGGGTPRLDDFPHLRRLSGSEEIAPRSFVARLPQRLLGHPNGGALAVVGHVERAWSCSFHTPRLGSQVQVFEGAFGRLLKGAPVGYAMEFFNEFYAALSTELTTQQENVRFGREPDDLAMSSIWTANNDARSYLVLGDPAVRVRTAAPGQPPAERRVIKIDLPQPPTAGVPMPPVSPQVPQVPPAPAAPATQAFAAFAAPAASRVERRQRLLQALQGRRLDEAYLRPDVRRDLEAEAADTDRDQLITPDQLEMTRELVAEKVAAGSAADGPAAFAFFSTDQVVIVPGFMASELSDVSPSGHGLIWLSLSIVFRDRLSALQLGPFDGSERDLGSPSVRVEPTGAVPVVYDLLRADLEARRYTTLVHAVDWRKDLEIAADGLAERLRTLATGRRPIHVVAHSQGAMVARRALQKLAGSPAADKIKNLVLLGPANFGSFSAAFALAGTHSLLPQLRKFTVQPADGLQPVLASMTGVYQLLPFDPARAPWLASNNIGDRAFWEPHVPVDADRLGRFFGWGRSIDSTAFDSRTTVILGDNNGDGTFAGAEFRTDGLQPVPAGLAGDGTVPNSCAVLPGVRTFLAPNTEHSQLPMYRNVLSAVRAVLKGQAPSLAEVSSNFADHLATVPVSVAPAPPPMERMVIRPPDAFALAPMAGPRSADADGLERVARMAKAAAAAAGVRIRITVEADPN